MKKKLTILFALTLVFCVCFTLAACKVDPHVAKFNANGGTVTLDGNPVGEDGVKCILVNEPVATKDGYRLVGWYLDEDFQNEVPSWPYVLAEDTTFYAKWEADVATYTVIFETKGGTPIASQRVSVLSSSPTTTRSGYTFLGWYDNYECSGAALTFPYTPPRDITLYAKWQNDNAPKYTLYLNPMEGDPLDPIENVSVVNASDLPTPTKTGSTFLHWCTDEELTTAVAFPYTLERNTTFYAKWDTPTVSYTITLVDAGNGVTATIGGNPATLTLQNGNYVVQGASGAALTLTTPTKTGASFQGWYTNSNFTGDPVTFPFTLDGNRYFYAKWQITGEPTPESTAELTQYFNKTAPQNYATGYGLLIQNSVANVKDNFYYTYFVGDNIGSIEYSDATGEWQPAYIDWAFARDDEATPYWMTYCQNEEGAYQYNNASYKAEPLTNIEEGFLMVYLKRLSELNPAQFIKVGSGASAVWYATEDYVDTAGQKLLGNASGDPAKYNITYTELVLRFDANGNVVGINAKSQVVDTYQLGQGTAATIYYYHHTITVDSTSQGLADIVAGFPAETAFYSDVNRPSGLYPVLNPDDTKRNDVASGDKTYTNEELAQALHNLTSFTSYYTLAGNTFNGLMYNPVTIVTDGNVGKIVTEAYSYKMGEQTATQAAAADMFFVYNEAENAFFLIAPNTNNGYDIYCDQYSYKNNYDYNQYLLGISGSGSAITFNCKYPAVSVKYLDASKFTYNSTGKYFEYTDARTMTAAGKALFGDMDLVYPEADETESYVYLRVYMNADKIVKVTAASELWLYGDSREFFVKELVVTDHATPSVTLPTGITADSCIAPGEEKVGGSTDALAAAIAATNTANYTYTDKFVYDDYDELGGVYGTNSDLYTHYNGITRIPAGGGKYYYLYFKDGKLYAQHPDRNEATQITLDWTGGDVEKANEWLAWSYPMSNLISADWFYEGKDGKFYGKADYMAELSAALTRYSGSESFLEQDAGLRFSDAYRWTVQLEFVSLEVSAGKLSNFYYSGVILVNGSAGSHTKPFSGYANFSYDGTVVSLPISSTVDQTRPTLQHFLGANDSLAVSDLGIASFDETANATGYKLYVYTTNTAAEPVTVIDDLTSGFDLKTVTELNVVAAPTTYYVSLQALGDGTAYLDGPLSERMVVVLSTLPRIAAPEVTLDAATKTLTVSAVANSTSFHYDVYKNSVTSSNLVAQDNVSGVSLDLTTVKQLANASAALVWQEKTTYYIVVYARPTDTTAYRESASVTISYTPPKAEGSYVSDLFAPFDFSQSFSLSLTNQGVSKNHIYATAPSVDAATLMGSSDKALDAAATYKMVLNLWYDAPSQKGKLLFYTYNPNGDGYNKDDVDLHPVHVVFRFTKSGNQLVGEFTKTAFGATVVSNKNYAMDLLFRSLGSIDQSKFVETSGSIADYRGLVYNYDADVENDATLQQTLANFSPLEELFGATFTYTGLQATVGYNKDGGLCTGNGVTLLATAEDGSVVVMKLVVSGVGGNHLGNIND